MKEITRVVNLQVTQIIRYGGLEIADDVIDAFEVYAKEGAEGVAELVKKNVNADDVLVTGVKVFVREEES